MKIRLIVGENTLAATLNDSITAREFAQLLPLELTLRDFHGIEKVSDLPRRLSTADAPAGAAAEPGDLTIYAPWGNLAIFYRPFEFANGLVPLGSIDSGVELLAAQTGEFGIRVEAA